MLIQYYTVCTCAVVMFLLKKIIFLKSDKKALAGEAERRRGEGWKDEIAQDSGVQGH